MRLATHIRRSGRPSSAFARRAGLSAAHLANILAGRRRPSASVAQAIIGATRGAVSLAELLAIPAKARKERTVPDPPSQTVPA